MTLKLIDISDKNINKLLSIEVHDSQKDFIKPTRFYIDKAKIENDLIIKLVLDDDRTIGYTVYDSKPYEKDGCHWILTLVIDKGVQNLGYGRQVLAMISKNIIKFPEFKSVRVAYHPSNHAAKRLFTSNDFIETHRNESGYCVASTTSN